MSHFNAFNSANVPASVPRLTRIITPAQEGLLDNTEHTAAPDLVAALTWMRGIVTASVAGGATPDAARKLALVENLTEWLGDFALEKQGLVLYDDVVMRFEDLPTH